MRSPSFIFPIVLVFVFTCVFSLQAGDTGKVLKEGRALEKDKKYDAALDLYARFLKDSPAEEVYREAASLLGKLQKYDQAEKLLGEGIARFPAKTSLLNLLGLIRFRKGDKAAAKEQWQKVLGADPGNSFAKEWLAKLDKEKPVEVTGSSEPAQASVADSSADSGSELSKDEQEALGKKLYAEMSTINKYETGKFEELHRQVIKKCSKTDWAQESCWRLSNMYLMADDNPNYEGIVELLEHLIKNYPDSPLIPDAKNRLLMACRNSGRHERVVSLYQELFALNPEPEEQQFMVWSLEYADSLAALGRKDEAKKLYEQVIAKDANRDKLEARVARERLAGL